MLISIETHIITCDFPGGGGLDPLPPPLDPHMQSTRSAENIHHCLGIHGRSSSRR